MGEPDPRTPDRGAQRKGSGSTARAPSADTERIVREYDVRTLELDTAARALSGGNQQKFIIGREMSHKPEAPDRHPPDPGRRRRRPGGDLGPHPGRRRRGLAVLLISADLEELIGLSDTIRVILRGRFVGDFRPARRPPRRTSGRRHDRGRGQQGGQLMLRRVLIGLAAPVLAIAMAMLITIGILVVSGNSVSGFLTTIFSMPGPRNVVEHPEQLLGVLYLVRARRRRSGSGCSPRCAEVVVGAGDGVPRHHQDADRDQHRHRDGQHGCGQESRRIRRLLPSAPVMEPPRSCGVTRRGSKAATKRPRRMTVQGVGEADQLLEVGGDQQHREARRHRRA